MNLNIVFFAQKLFFADSVFSMLEFMYTRHNFFLV
jgi:hypothetical protein